MLPEYRICVHARFHNFTSTLLFSLAFVFLEYKRLYFISKLITRAYVFFTISYLWNCESMWKYNYFVVIIIAKVEGQCIKQNHLFWKLECINLYKKNCNSGRIYMNYIRKLWKCFQSYPTQSIWLCHWLLRRLMQTFCVVGSYLRIGNVLSFSLFFFSLLSPATSHWWEPYI